MMRGLWALVVLVSMLAAIVHGAIPEHLVVGLPGQPSVNFKQYAGYINVNEALGNHIFYWFVEADHEHASSLPVAVWFNGGPGCSSVGDGFLSELGPFYPNISGDLGLNKFSWNKEANMIFVESPVEVGFSYSDAFSNNSVFTDGSTAADAYTFLVNWFKGYPEYSKNDLYIVGESYGGHYVPTLVQEVVRHNKEGVYNLNLKGFAVGNAWTDAYWDNKGSVDWFLSHSFISDETYKGLIKNCDFAHEFPIDNPDTNPLCKEAATALNVDLSGVNVYNVYTPSCNLPINSSVRTSMKAKIRQFPASAAIDACADNVTPYLNKPEVKAALHVRADIEWSECSNPVFDNYSTSDILTSMVPIYRELVKTGLRIWIYSGDFDGRVPTTGTRDWIQELHLPIVKAWYPWQHGGKAEVKEEGEQVGGFAEVYGDNFSFVSVRAAGHLVPADQPALALTLFKTFLSGEALPPFIYPVSS